MIIQKSGTNHYYQLLLTANPFLTYLKSGSLCVKIYMYTCLYRQNAHGLWEGIVQTWVEEMFLRFPQTVPKPAPEPATLTVAAPVSMNLTACYVDVPWNGAPYLEVVAKGWVDVWGYGTARMLRLSFVFLVTSVALQTPRRLYRWSWSRHCILGGEGPRSTVPRPKKPRLLFETVSLCNFDWFGTCCIDEAGLSHRDHLLCCHSSVIKEVHPTPGPCF